MRITYLKTNINLISFDVKNFLKERKPCPIYFVRILFGSTLDKISSNLCASSKYRVTEVAHIKRDRQSWPHRDSQHISNLFVPPPVPLFPTMTFITTTPPKAP